MRILAKALWIVLAGAAIACADGFKAGVARTDITPPVPYWLSGYASRTNAATAVRNRLWAKALAVEDEGGGRAVLVTLDIIGLPREITDDVAERIRRQHGIERSQLLLNFSHTHYGPVVRHNLSVMYDFDAAMQEKVKQYSAKLGDDLVALAGAALADLKPATLACGHGTAGFAGNRRQKTGTGYRIGVNPDGPVDHDVPVLAVTGADGRLRAALFGYACHNTTMSGGYNEVDSDYAGFAQRAVEEAHPGAAAMFLMLCGADQNPNPRGEYAHVEQHGRELADSVNRTLAGPLQPVLPPVRTAVRLARLDLAPHERAVFEAEAADAKSNQWKQRRAKQMLEDYDRGAPMRQVEVPVQCIRFHTNLTVLALGGEVVVDYALRAKREFPTENLVVAGYSHDVMSYIPSLRVLREGGYEAVDSMIYYGKPGPYAETAEESLFDAIREVLRAAGGSEPQTHASSGIHAERSPATAAHTVETRIRFHKALLSGNEVAARRLVHDEASDEPIPGDIMVRLKLLDAVPGEEQTRDLVKLYSSATNITERLALMLVLNQRGRGHWIFGRWADFLDGDPTCLPALCGALDSSSPCWSTANQYGSVALDLVDHGEPLSRTILARLPSAGRLAASDNAQAMATSLLGSLQASISAHSPAVEGIREEELKALQASLRFHSATSNGDATGYQELVDARTDRPSVYYRLARWHERQKASERAKATVALGLRNCTSGVALLLGLSAEQRVGCGDIEGASNDARRCLGMVPSNPMAQFAMCEVYLSTGNRPAAMEACAQGLASSYGWGQEILRAGERALAKLGVGSDDGRVAWSKP